MRKSIQMKMLISFSFIVFLACTMITGVNYYTSTKLVEETVGKQAGLIADKALNLIDVEKYKGITIENGENDYYHELRSELNNLREATGLLYLYTMSRSKTDDTYEYYYMVDGMPGEDASDLGELEEDATKSFPKMGEAFDTGEVQTDMTFTEEYGGIVSTYIPIKDSNGKVLGIVGADSDVTDVYTSMEENKNRILLITIGILFICLIFVFVFSHYLVKPLKRLTKQVEKVSKGELSLFTVKERSDEIGKLTSAFQQMLTDLRNMIQGINYNSNLLTEKSQFLLKDVHEVHAGSNQVVTSVQEVALNAETQFQHTKDSAHSLNEMTLGVQQIASASADVTLLSASTLLEAEKGYDRVSNAVNHMDTMNQSVKLSEVAMNQLEARSSEISNIVKIISDISDQTNLLALNATIEAARAGDHGKGFAVVANEVRKLAEQSQLSANHIHQLILTINEDTSKSKSTLNTVIEDVQKGIHVVEEAGESFSTILGAIKKIDIKIHEVSTTLEEIYASTEEISASAVESTSLAEKSTEKTKLIKNIAIEQDHYVGKMTKEINQLNEMSEELRCLVQRFTI